MFFSFLFFVSYLFCLFFFCHSFLGGGYFFDVFFCSLSGVDLSFSALFDYVSLGFFSCVSFISCLVFSYSLFYMSGTVDNRRFSWLVFGFVISMFFLVFSGNFFFVMVGWDGLGLTSFCLVVFYYNHSSLESGLVTVFSNRVGDVFFLLCFFFFFVAGNFTFDVGSNSCFLLFFSFLFLGAITKSAQAPFSAWLPAAMAAPTPVSSLVHSSTLVTAGVYVLVRFFYLFFWLDFVVMKIFFILTMLVAGGSANFEKDFKKTVAMSTLSQLGMMLYILSVGLWVMSFLHMIIHAFFKSMLFLSSGSLMSHQSGGQDSRFYGSGVVSFSSLLFFLVSNVCLAGFPFYIGFYSKDFILLGGAFELGFLFYLLFLMGCLFTIMYSLRLFLMSYFYWFKSSGFLFFSEDFNFVFPVIFLFFKGWILGGLFYWVFLSESILSFNFLDVFFGLLLIFFGCFLFKIFNLGYYSFFSLCTILLMRWFSGGGSSFLSKSLGYYKWEGGWLELGGGQGVHSLIYNSSLFFDFYKKVGLGFLFLVLLFVSLSFYI